MRYDTQRLRVIYDYTHGEHFHAKNFFHFFHRYFAAFEKIKQHKYKSPIRGRVVRQSIGRKSISAAFFSS